MEGESVGFGDSSAPPLTEGTQALQTTLSQGTSAGDALGKKRRFATHLVLYPELLWLMLVVLDRQHRFSKSQDSRSQYVFCFSTETI